MFSYRHVCICVRLALTSWTENLEVAIVERPFTCPCALVEQNILIHSSPLAVQPISNGSSNGFLVVHAERIHQDHTRKRIILGTFPISSLDDGTRIYNDTQRPMHRLVDGYENKFFLENVDLLSSSPRCNSLRTVFRESRKEMRGEEVEF